MRRRGCGSGGRSARRSSPRTARRRRPRRAGGCPGGAAAVALRLQGRVRARPRGALPGEGAGSGGAAGRARSARAGAGRAGELRRGWAEAAAGVRSEAAVSRLGRCRAPAGVSPGVPPVPLLTHSAELQEQLLTTKKRFYLWLLSSPLFSSLPFFCLNPVCLLPGKK